MKKQHVRIIYLHIFFFTSLDPDPTLPYPADHRISRSIYRLSGATTYLVPVIPVLLKGTVCAHRGISQLKGDFLHNSSAKQRN
jgi:hypothetical protein